MRFLAVMLTLAFVACGDMERATPEPGPGSDALHGDPDLSHRRPPDSGPVKQKMDAAPAIDLAADTALPPDLTAEIAKKDIEPNDFETCSAPNYPTDCSQVSYFECGFWATCTDGKTITARWHVHVFCPDMEQIHEYNCTYVCPNGCVSDYSGWPQSGAHLLQEACNP